MAAVGILVGSGCLPALNPKIEITRWAMGVLEDFRRKGVLLRVPPAALLEPALILRPRKVSDGGKGKSFERLTP